jgi:GAF domain-containing protein
MKKRSKAGREPTKGLRSKTAKPERRRAPKAVARSNLPPAREKTEVARLRRERNEALEQQTATSEVLQAISRSTGDLEPVFGTILEKAVRYCDANFGTLFLYEKDQTSLVAAHNMPTAFSEAHRKRPGTVPGGPVETAMRTRRAVHVPDLAATQSYRERHPRAVDAVELGSVRTTVAVPMLKDNEPIGVIAIHRPEVRPFTDKQIELVQNFAAQAVIAIENARLLNELRQRTDDLSKRTTDLTEALEQQTATSEVLQLISRSPGDLKPVFASMLENAVRICDAKFAIMNFPEPGGVRPVAMHNVPEAFAELRQRVVHFGPKHPLTRVAATKQVMHVPDLELYADEDAVIAKFRELTGARTILHVPMLKDEELVGIVSIYRQEVRPFTDKQVDLVKSFAAQAVIAVENARLLNELRQSLEQQTAMADVLKIISRSTFDLPTVLNTLTQWAVRLCLADKGIILLRDGDVYRWQANHGFSPEALRYASEHPVRADHGTLTGRVALEGKAVQIRDVLADPEYRATGYQQAFGYRTALAVPLLREEATIGVFFLSRDAVNPFNEKQIELVTTFADQAVIAIENARLLNELRQRTDELAAQSQELAELNQQLEQRVGDQVGEIERMSRLRRFLPPQVADLIVASGTEKQLESHRREITALFCDLRGFTGFTESADAEDVIVLLREYHAAVGEKIIKYSGTLERYAGDGVMVVFNDPVPVENPALQAVLMALEVRDAIGALTGKWGRFGHDIGFGIGIAHGYATLGTIGFEGRFDYAAIGTVSNVASRLCDEAKPGQILISPRVLVAVEDAVKVEPVGEFELKGIRRPLAAYNVVAANLESRATNANTV